LATEPIRLSDVQHLSVELAAEPSTNPSDLAVVRVYLALQHGAASHWLDLSFVASRALSGEVTLLNLHAPTDFAQIAERLMRDQLYYSQSIWMNADPQALIMQLAAYETAPLGVGAMRVVDSIDPRPVGVAGNYLAFRYTYEADEAWKDWKASELRASRPDVDLVPMSTGGVFAEAVLGEFNAAEKLDATRFWNWTDSEIPFVAGDMQSAEAGRHARVEAPVPGALPQPVVSIREVPALPQLASSADVLKALAASKIFTDMSGSEVTRQLLAAAPKAARARATRPPSRRRTRRSRTSSRPSAVRCRPCLAAAARRSRQSPNWEPS
jgi:hypothetical protein